MRLDKKTHDHDVQRSKENALKRKAKWEKRANLERAQMEELSKGKVAVLFFGMGFRKQKDAQNFWVSLPFKVNTKDIRRRIEVGFGDLEKT